MREKRWSHRRKVYKADEGKKLHVAIQDKKKQIQLPELRLRYRILLYICMLIFSALALINVVLDCFSFEVGIVIYVFAACMLFTSCVCLIVLGLGIWGVWNSKHLNRKLELGGTIDDSYTGSGR